MKLYLPLLLVAMALFGASCSQQEQVKDPILTEYYSLKDALVATDAVKAKAAASSLAATASSTPGMNLVADYASTIAESDNIEAQRETFEILSISIYEVLAEGNPHAETVYVQYCPMAFDNKGAFWLSNNEEILNPYFGDKMLKCGVVKETLTAL